MTLITSEWLCKKHACAEQVAVFEREWPDGAEITEANVLRALTLKLDIVWFAAVFLQPSAWAAYKEAIASPRAAYEEAAAPAWANEEAAASAWAAYKEAVARCLIGYLREPEGVTA